MQHYNLTLLVGFGIIGVHICQNMEVSDYTLYIFTGLKGSRIWPIIKSTKADQPTTQTNNQPLNFGPKWILALTINMTVYSILFAVLDQPNLIKLD